MNKSNQTAFAQPLGMAFEPSYTILCVLYHIQLSKKRGIRVCGDVFLLYCGFAEIFIFSSSIAVLQNQAVCGI